MKKFALFLIGVIVFGLTTEAQIKYGLRGGISSSQLTLDDAMEVATSDENNVSLKVQAKNAKVGFHFGGMMQVTLANIYIQPELLFVSTGGEVLVTKISNDGQVLGSTLAAQRFMKLDIPLVAGWKLGPARLGLGPMASFYLSSNDELKEIIEDEVGGGAAAEEKFTTATWALQLDAGLNMFGKIALDVKYEIGLSKLGSGVEIDETSYNFIQRNNQLIFSVGYMF